MNVMVSGLPSHQLAKVEAEIRAALAQHVGDINVVVTRLPSGAWVTFAFDAETGAELKVPGLAQLLATTIR